MRLVYVLYDRERCCLFWWKHAGVTGEFEHEVKDVHYDLEPDVAIIPGDKISINQAAAHCAQNVPSPTELP